MNNESILVIGCGGQLGIDMVTIARNAGYTVTGMDFPQIDISNPTSVFSCISENTPSIVINCAAFTAVDDCEKEQERAYAINGEGPGHIAEACEMVHARMVHISTDYVFNGCKTGPYVESDAPDPQSIYGKSKLEGEKKVVSACSNHQIFRIAWLYGLHGKNFVFTIRTLARKALEKTGEITVVNDQFGTPTSTTEVCHQIIKAQESDLTGIIHTTCEGTCTWFDFATSIIKAANIPVTIVPCTSETFPRPAPRPKNSILENRRLKETGINIMQTWDKAFNAFLQSEDA